MALVLHAGNDLERLTDHLIARLHADLQTGDPAAIFAEQVVVVPTVGLRDWLRQRIAEHLGICAGIRFCYPTDLFAWLAERLQTLPADGGWTERALWPCLQQLATIEELRDYLGDEHDRPGARSHALAAALVDCFDRYALYRPTWLQAWAERRAAEFDDEAPWQPVLWRGLLRAGCGDPVAAHADLVSTLRQPSDRLPACIHAVGFNNLSPRLLEVFKGLGAIGELVIYSLQPTWGDWLDQRSRARLLRDGEPLLQADGNRLLGDWGGIGQVFLRQVDDVGAAYLADPDDFRIPDGPQVLQRLQRDIALAQAAGDEGPHVLAEDDRSLRCHACHDLRRQLEVVKEELHQAFTELPGLQPHDIAIMSPDPEAVGPLAAAVLGGSSGGPPIPVVVADRRRGSVDPAADVLIRILALLPGRFTAGAVLDFLGTTAVARAWGFGSDELGIIRDWIDTADLRWGIDADHRQAVTGHAFAAGSWRRGLQRLQLAWWYGEDTADAKPFAAVDGDPADAVVPVAGFDPGQFESLKRLSLLLEPILERAETARRGAPIEWWRQHLVWLVQHVLRVRDDDADLAQVAATVGGWAEQVVASGWTDSLAAELVHAHLRDACAQPVGGDFARGAVTVCGLQPMRSIPFAVLCLVGMDDGAFPRQARGLDVDLIRLHPRPGDRDLRREDRYLFLELLISVRERLCITWTGFDGRDNSVLPPAGMVGELLDVVADTCGVSAVPAGLIQQHRLHRSLEGPVWPAVQIAAECLALAGARRQPGFAAPTVTVEPQPVITAADLVLFWRQPAKAYLRSLGVQLASFDEAPRDHERFAAAAGLDRYQAARRLLTAATSDVDRLAEERELQHRLAAEGWLPPGALGHQAWVALTDFINQLLDLKHEVVSRCLTQQVTVSLPDHRSLTAEFPLVHPARGVVLIHPGRASLAKHLELWIQLVVAASAGLCRSAVLLHVEKGRVQELMLDCPGDPQPHLQALLAGFDQGQADLLPFAVRLSGRYAQLRWAGRREGTHPRAVERALRREWQPDDFAMVPPECTLAEHHLVWSDTFGPTREPSFIDWARRIWLPAWQAQNTSRGKGRSR